MLLFLIYAMNRCNGDDNAYAMIAEKRARVNYLDSLQRAEDSIQRINAINAEAEARAEALRRAATQPLPGDSVVRIPEPQIVREKVTTLYVTFDGLNVRKGPGLNYGKVDRLKLYDAVTFLNEITDSTYQISLGDVTPDEPWIKILTPSGKEGWVYGAGVDYYKRKLEGVIN
ncbi:MAG: SH3 domain-containing protein [Bacteroidota bacterium]